METIISNIITKTKWTFNIDGVRNNAFKLFKSSNGLTIVLKDYKTVSILEISSKDFNFIVVFNIIIDENWLLDNLNTLSMMTKHSIVASYKRFIVKEEVKDIIFKKKEADYRVLPTF